LRQHRHELFDEEFQAELARLYADRPKGRPPVPPAQLALATTLQVVEATLMDRRWQLRSTHPSPEGTLVEFRKRLIAADADRRLVERSVQLAEQIRGFGATALRAALDSNPLWGRAEDTYTA
jgi:transposase